MEIEVKIEPERLEAKVVIYAPAMTPEVKALIDSLQPAAMDLIPGFRGSEASLLKIDSILRLYGEDKEVCAQTGGGVYTLKARLYELEQRLPGQFVRISHSEIVNLRQVAGLDLSLSGTIRMTLAGGTVCCVSRRYVKKIKEALGI